MEVFIGSEETEYRYYDKSGDASLTVCNVFDGVDIRGDKITK